MPKYAQNTNVSSAASRIEIENTLIRYGAENFAYAAMSGKAAIGFTMCGRNIKFILPLPTREEFRNTPTGRDRTEKSQNEAWEQACRQSWRALNLVIKAKLEAIESGISVFENEFMANIVLPGGKTVGEYIAPEIEAAYRTGNVPQLLPQF